MAHKRSANLKVCTSATAHTRKTLQAIGVDCSELTLSFKKLKQKSPPTNYLMINDFKISFF